MIENPEGYDEKDYELNYDHPDYKAAYPWPPRDWLIEGPGWQFYRNPKYLKKKDPPIKIPDGKKLEFTDLGNNKFSIRLVNIDPFAP